MRGTALTDRQRQVLDYIRSHIKEWGVPPSRAEIARALGFAFASAADNHLKALERKGWLQIHPGRDHGLKLLREGVPVFDPDDLPAVAAGEPLLADESKAVMRVPEAISAKIHPHADCYLVVHGDSMDRMGYRSGDIVALKRSPDPNDGDIVVARIEDSITLKRFRRTDRRTIHLEPESSNPAHTPILIDETTESWEIVGVVVGAMVGPPLASAPCSGTNR